MEEEIGIIVLMTNISSALILGLERWGREL